MKNIICIGDSNTYGYDPRSFLGGRYPKPWPELLIEHTSSTVINLGENGREVPHHPYQIAAIDSQIKNHYKPGDIFIVMLGTNDILNEYDNQVETATNRMKNYLCHIKETYVASCIYLISPPKITALGFEMNQISTALSNSYKELALDLQINYFDSNDWNIQMSYDGVHLTAEGHESFSKELSDYLECIMRA